MSCKGKALGCGASGRSDMLGYEIVALFIGDIKQTALCARQKKLLVLIHAHTSWIHLKYS
jgi:hypothetical protein